MSVKHPAKYNDALIPVFAKLLKEHKAKNVLDPMAGTGKIWDIRKHGYLGHITCNEIEPEWADEARKNVVTGRSQDRSVVTEWDAADMGFDDGEFDAIVTSPTYGNRMADHHDAKDGSKRYTYKHMLGRDLNPENTGQMQWGEEYRRKHEAIWRECLRVLRPGGLMVVNVKDHYRNGRLQPVSLWHVTTLRRLGCSYRERIKVSTPGLRVGANAHSRVGHEDVWVLVKKA